MNELVKLDKPQMPVYWECDDSIKFVSEYVFKWKTITKEIANELFIARTMLSTKGGYKFHKEVRGSKEPSTITWGEYCNNIGSSKGVVNKWLKQWFEIVHVSQNSGENEWYTPSPIVESAKSLMGSIDLDPASSEIANKNIKAKKIFTEKDNGLEQEWSGNIWMNPPYAQPLINKFSEKLVSELSNIKQACVLVNNATETNWLQNMMKECNVICFVKGRVKFIDIKGNASGAPLQGQVILYFGENVEGFYNNFKGFGICMVKIEEK